MSTLGLIPFVQLREFDNSGMLLSGGKVYFYRAGSTTPLPTYQNAAGTIANTNPVILNSAGSAKIFLLPVKYKVEIFDADDQLIFDIDEVGSEGGATLGGTGSLAIVKNYDELRGLTEDFEAILVLGRDEPSDGGQGWFYPSDSTAADDDGVLLVRESTSRYKRELNGYIEPLWFGLAYDSVVDQHTVLLTALTAGITYNTKVVLSGNVYLQTNTTIPTNSILEIQGSVYGPALNPPTITFADNAVLIGCSNAGIALPVSLGIGCLLGSFNSSWLGGGDDTELSRLSDLSTHGYTVNIDKEYDVSVDISIPQNLAVDFIGGLLTIDTGSVDVTIENLIYTGLAKIFNYTLPQYINTLSLNVPFRPEWAGAIGDGINDDSAALEVAFSTQSSLFTHGKEYRLCKQVRPANLVIFGDLANALVYPNPLTAESIPTPKLKFGVTGETYTLTPDAVTDPGLVIPFEIPALANYQIVAVAYHNSKYVVATSRGYLYQLDVVDGVYVPTLLTSVKRKYRTLWTYNSNLYSIVDAGAFNSEMYHVTISGSTATETSVFTDTSFGIAYITDISGTVYVASTLGVVKTLSTSTWTLGATVGSFSHLCRGLTYIGTTLYGLVVSGSTNIYTVESMSTSGVVALVCTLTGYNCSGISKYGSDLYVTQKVGQVLKVTTTGTINAWTTNANTLIWGSIGWVNSKLFVYGRSIVSPLVTGIVTGHIALSAKGVVAVDGIALDGSDSSDGIALINTLDGDIGLNNSISYYVISESAIDATNSMIDTNLTSFATAVETANTILVDYTTTDTKKHYSGDVAFENVYLEENKDALLLGTDVDGKVISKDTLDISDVGVDNLIINNTLDFSSKTVEDLTYTVLDDDPVLLAFTATSGLISVTLPASVPAGKTKFRILCRANSSQYYFSINGNNIHLGSIIGAYLPSLIAGAFATNKTMAFCYFVNGKWCIN